MLQRGRDEGGGAADVELGLGRVRDQGGDVGGGVLAGGVLSDGHIMNDDTLYIFSCSRSVLTLSSEYIQCTLDSWCAALPTKLAVAMTSSISRLKGWLAASEARYISVF